MSCARRSMPSSGFPKSWKAACSDRWVRKNTGNIATRFTSGHYLLEVINDILDMSKIEAGRMKLDMEPLDLSKTLMESLRVVSGRADDKNLQLDADIDGPISIVADRRATKQIVVNLLSNAVKFTPDGGKVVVRSRLVHDLIVLLIADTGIGIARNHCSGSAARSSRSKAN